MINFVLVLSKHHSLITEIYATVTGSFLLHLQVPLLLRPGAALADQLPGVRGDTGAARGC